MNPSMPSGTDNAPENDPSLDDDPVIRAFDAVCERLHGFDPSLDAEWIDGYLTALAASWRAIPLSEALPLMCGDVFERVFADPEDLAGAVAALAGRLAMLRAQLDVEALVDETDTLRLAPLMQDWGSLEDEERERLRAEHGDDVDLLNTGAAWAAGFFVAVADFEADWLPPRRIDREAAEDFAALRRTVEMLTLRPQDPQVRAFLAEQWPADAQPSRDELVDEALFAVQELRMWWAAYPPSREPVRAAPAPGRNDPCPCGSGRKFKKCCGAG